MKTPALLALTLALAVPLAPATADPVRFGVMGDSLTDPYAQYTGNLNPNTGRPFWGYAGDLNWVEQLQTLRPSALAVMNHAHAGVTSGELLQQGQHTDVAQDVRDGITHAVLIVGANDIGAYVAATLSGNPLATVGTYVANVQTALETVQAAGPVRIVVGNIPDLTVTPALQGLLGNTAGALTAVRDVIQAANTQLAQLAAAKGVPVVDLFGMSQLVGNSSIMVGGTPVPPEALFASDGFHPGTLIHGLLANAIIEAYRVAYGSDLAALRLSDQEILSLARLPHNNTTTYYDVSGFVQFGGAPNETPEPATLTLALIAGGCGLLVRARRRRAAA